jgi:ankyrin repeat protein
MSLALDNLKEFWWCLTDDDCLDIPLTEVSQINIFGESPIHIAAWKGTVEDILWLLNNGADINQRGEFGMSPLHYAYIGGNSENIQALLSAGANPSVKCDFGLRPNESRPI